MILSDAIQQSSMMNTVLENVHFYEHKIDFRWKYIKLPALQLPSYEFE